MKHWFLAREQREHVRLIARFGQAELVVTGRGKVELRGGSEADVQEAREWISLFLHEAVPVRVPGPVPASRSEETERGFRIPIQKPSASVGALV